MATAVALAAPLRLAPSRRWRFSADLRAEPPSRLSSRRGASASFPTAAATVPKVLDDSVIEPYGIRDYIERSRELIKPDGGPPRWFSPLECGARGTDSPLLLYLPGIDGTGLGLIRHHHRLGKIFDIWCLHIPVMDRTSFEGLVEYVERTINSEKSYSLNKPIYLVGESIGACLALAVAARNPDFDLVMILANPATSFSKSQLQSVSTFLGILPEPLHVTIPYFVNFITGYHLTFRDLPDNFNDMLADLSFLVDILPKESFVWKLDLLKSAALFVNSRLHVVKAQILILASGRDQLLPSHEEAERICSNLPNCRIRHFKESGHTMFLESGIDLVTIIKGAGYYRRSSQIDYVSDYLLPTPLEFQQATEIYRWFDLATSPVMLSTLQNGKIVKGLMGIPSKGPTLLVGYHMLLGLELGIMFSRFFTEKRIHLRGLAHPFMFNRASEQLMPDSSSFDGHRLMGAVPVSATNFYKLLSMKSFVLLYPGGAREALHRKVLLDYEDLVKIPFYDTLNKRINQDGVRLRTDTVEEVGNQDLYPPVLLPKIPGRLYFLFGKPIETRGRSEELRDRKQAQQLYIHVKSEVENCMAYLKEKREKDPYRNLLPRLLYQTTNGFTNEVPTFEI
ncbi:phytyl ester synthase 2, chloroplastic-like isoform X4 [Musa acuminata AAA Group]|uniref:Serine aminopeptidase S33 domain-containing protein n=1 Tax=Musa acuminata subsp. malaccensis TaxID=214687 RepID=A0A804K7Q9_MUSAM|nr:PREDICTED: acyltransferase-like protein At3g26840, chloroplastic isoform X3 [Musa acuminata subsp. malaccensis]